jgi:hypothetical protein
MYGITPSPPSTPPPKGVYHIASLTSNAKYWIVELEQEIFALRSGKPFAHLLMNQSATSSGNQASSSKPPLEPTTPRPVKAPSASSTATNHSTSILAPTSSSSSITEPSPSLTSSTQAVIHPFAAAKESSYLPLHECNFAGPSKGKEHEDQIYHTQAPVQNDKIAAEVFSRSMKTPIIMLTSEELLLLSPEVRMKWKEQVTSK